MAITIRYASHDSVDSRLVHFLDWYIHGCIFFVYATTLAEENEYVLCWACKKGEVGKAHQCVTCKHYVHVFCGTPAEGYEEGHGQKVICSLCFKGIDNGTQYLFIVFTYF